MKAYILIKTKPGTSEKVVKNIRERVGSLLLADSIYGRYDAIIGVEAPDLEKLNEIVYKIIVEDPNIIHTGTSLAFS